MFKVFASLVVVGIVGAVVLVRSHDQPRQLQPRQLQQAGGLTFTVSAPAGHCLDGVSFPLAPIGPNFWAGQTSACGVTVYGRVIHVNGLPHGYLSCITTEPTYNF